MSGAIDRRSNLAAVLFVLWRQKQLATPSLAFPIFCNIELSPTVMAESSPVAAGSSPVEATPGFASFTLPRAVDDLHLHARDGAILVDVLAPMLLRNTVRRAILMPNLQPPVTDARLARDYRDRVLQAVAQVNEQRRVSTIQAPFTPIEFMPLMTLYLTDHTTPREIQEAKAEGLVYACKLYPQGATTHSSQGVSDVKALLPVLQAMAEVGLLLLVHGEVTDPRVDIFEREAAFLPTIEWMLQAVPTLRIVLEHVTSRAGVEFVQKHASLGRLGATITAHHLLHNRNALFDGGLNPHAYCLPVLKTESDRQALLAAVFDPTTRRLFFAGTDSAPHVRANKEKSHGCAAGCFTAFATVELYFESLVPAAEAAGLTHAAAQLAISDFLCHNGAAFYGLEPNPPQTIQLVKRPWTVPHSMPLADGTIIPLRAGQTLSWATTVKTSVLNL